MYLWSGRANNDKAGYLKWDQVCSSKKQGGLGFRNITLWNKVAAGKIIWHVGIKKKDLLVKWLHEVYIKGQSWWDFSSSTTG